jgi:hypothetical protein
MSNSAKKPMKALSVQQPWATLLSIGAKLIETRSWSIAYRGAIAIHASRSYPAEIQMIERRPEFYSALHRDGKYSDPIRDAGCVIAVADVVGCVDVAFLHSGKSPHAKLLTERELAFGDFSPRRFGWVLGNVRRLQKPIPCKGSRSLWTLPPNVEFQILEELCA